MNDLLARLIASGTPAELVAEVAMELGRAQGEARALEAMLETAGQPDPVAERRRAYDRERKRRNKSGGMPVESAESVEQDGTPLKVSPHTPLPKTPVYNNPPTPQGGEVVDLAGKPVREPRKPRNREPDFVLPPEIPAEPWDAWVAMRTRIRKPLTEQAKRLAADKLIGFVGKGHSAAEILNNSTMNGWQGLFEPTAPKPAPAAGSGAWDAFTRRRGSG